MAEAHSVAALSVSLTHDGISISYDQELLNEILHSFFRAYKKRVARFKGWNVFASTLTNAVWNFHYLTYFIKSGLMLHSFQGALPHLPLPRLNDTLDKHLCTMRPVCTDKEYDELVQLTEEFRNGVGRHLQWYLIIKSFLSINYVADWWEEFVYLRQRSPIMINSNYYGFDSILAYPTRNQAARAAVITWAALLFRRKIERQEIKPFSFLSQYKIPFCTAQYERLFNSCRIACLEKDEFHHWSDAKHIAVYCNGFEAILNEKVNSNAEEKYIAALTAGDRDMWAQARKNYFNSGINQLSLHAIEKAAFVIILDEHEVFYDRNDSSKLDFWANSLLHGRGYDRWFDKSFNLIIFKNGRIGINAEHSWFGDAAVPAHFMEFCVIKSVCENLYDENGNTSGEVESIPKFDRLRWHITPELNKWPYCFGLSTAKFYKKLRVSPDGFLQLVLQLAFYRNQKKFALTYEATTARLFREGRTETVRSCSSYSCDFVHAMLDPNQTYAERLRLLRIACEYHQKMYRDAMYIVMRYLKFKSPFLERIFPPTFLLSTSQTPVNQCEEEAKLANVDRNKFVTAGGGFGPVADNGYGVSYIIVSESIISFHVSSKRSADNTLSFLRRLAANFIHFHNDILWPKEMKDMLLECCTVTPNFITEQEEASLLDEINPHMKRMRYEKSHWDDAIHLYREREQLNWKIENEAVLNRVRKQSFKEGDKQLLFVHILDLHEDGIIKPHIDSIRYCGDVIAGLSLLSDAVMRLRHKDRKDQLIFDLFLQRKSLYRMRQAYFSILIKSQVISNGGFLPFYYSLRIAIVEILLSCQIDLIDEFSRYEFYHEVLGKAESYFMGKLIPRSRRISIIFRDLPRNVQQTESLTTSTAAEKTVAATKRH
ncbi:Carnitine palmitoyltransferase 1A (Liver) [Dirofilaria immitis]|nr:Carnitine palmitoyltransferase 1A (Liver) [Dirofilaria immitis]